MSEHHLILPALRAVLPCHTRQEIVCIGGGRPPASDWLSRLVAKDAQKSPPIWAIDRGVNICRALQLSPALLIGDGDSADAEAWTWAVDQGAKLHSFPPEKDFTDTELALHIVAQNVRDPLVILTAAFGGRLDHLMSTASVSAHAPIPCVLADER